MSGEAAKRPPTTDETAAAELRVASAGTLWEQFTSELRRLGSVDERGAEGVRLYEGEGSAVRTLLVTPQSLRDVFVTDVVMRTRTGERDVRIPHLPQWFIDGLLEAVGADECAADEPYLLLLESGELAPSTRPTPPPLRAPVARGEPVSGGRWTT